MGYLILILCLYVVLMFVSCFAVCKEDKPMFTNNGNIVVIKSEDVADYYLMCGDEHVSVDRETDKMDGVTLIFKSRDELEMLISKLELLRAKTEGGPLK